MITITLNHQAAQILTDVIECYLEDLRMEIRHTDDHSFKAMLKQRRELLEAVQINLKANTPQPAAMAS